LLTNPAREVTGLRRTVPEFANGLVVKYSGPNMAADPSAYVAVLIYSSSVAMIIPRKSPNRF